MSKRYVGRHRTTRVLVAHGKGKRVAQAGAVIVLSGGLLGAVVDVASADPSPSGSTSEDPSWEPRFTDPRPLEDPSDAADDDASHEGSEAGPSQTPASEPQETPPTSRPTSTPLPSTPSPSSPESAPVTPAPPRRAEPPRAPKPRRTAPAPKKPAAPAKKRAARVAPAPKAVKSLPPRRGGPNLLALPSPVVPRPRPRSRPPPRRSVLPVWLRPPRPSRARRAKSSESRPVSPGSPTAGVARAHEGSTAPASPVTSFARRACRCPGPRPRSSGRYDESGIRSPATSSSSVHRPTTWASTRAAAGCTTRRAPAAPRDCTRSGPRASPTGAPERVHSFGTRSRVPSGATPRILDAAGHGGCRWRALAWG